MIEVNLMIKPAPRLRWRNVAMLGGPGLVLLGVAAYSVFWWFEYQAATQERAVAVEAMESWRQALSRGPSVAQQEEHMQKELAQLAAISRNQAPGGQVAVLRAIFGAAPPGVAVTQVAVSRDGEITVGGEAPGFDQAVQYLAALRRLTVLADVTERKAVSAPDGKTAFTFAASLRREGTR